jgi:putative oxidoreductase
MIDGWIERNRDVLILVARVLLTVLFVISGFGKLTDYSGTVGYMSHLGAPLPSLAAAVAIVMELLVGLALLAGVALRPLALALMLFVAGTAVLGHPFWSMDGADRALNQIHFLKNLAIMGGLLLLAITGAGRFALSRS